MQGQRCNLASESFPVPPPVKRFKLSVATTEVEEIPAERSATDSKVSVATADLTGGSTEVTKASSESTEAAVEVTEAITKVIEAKGSRAWWPSAWDISILNDALFLDPPSSLPRW